MDLDTRNNRDNNDDDGKGSNSDYDPYDEIHRWRSMDTESHNRKAHDSTCGNGVTEPRIILSRIDYTIALTLGL